MKIHSLSALAFLSLSGASAMAVPAKPGIHSIVQPDGSVVQVRIEGDEYGSRYTTPDGTPLTSKKGYLTPAKSGDESVLRRGIPRRANTGLFPGTNFPATGNQRGLVILVEYTDVKFMSSYDPHTYFTNLLNQEGFSDFEATGSARDYFVDNSNGTFTPTFDVFGPITLPHPQSYYGGNGVSQVDLRGWEMILHACQALDPEVDFSQYDRDGDGAVDNVFVFYAGGGEASGGGENSVWPHSANLSDFLGKDGPLKADGVIVNRYACANEVQGGSPDGIGTFVHEFSHVLGLPDLYATASNFGGASAFTPGAWSVMDIGPYNNNSHTPPHYSAFELEALGWLKPELISGPMSIRLEDITSGQAYKVEKQDNPNEYFLFENRQRRGWDSYIPGHGMLVWHIDYAADVWIGNRVNNSDLHQYVDIEEADGIKSQTSRSGDSFPGASGVTSFTDDTTPSMRFWDGSPAAMPIRNIREEEGVISFDVAQGQEKPQAVVAMEASNIKYDSFTANWTATTAENASYLITVYDNGTAMPQFKRLAVGSGTSFAVKGLEAEHDYSFSVIVVTKYGESDPSNTVQVRTAMLPLSMRRPTGLRAESSGQDSFRISWDACPAATDYLINIYSKVPGDPTTTCYDFGGYPASLPEGWTSDSRETYVMASMCGTAAPSLRMGTPGNYLTIGPFSDGIQGISFWARLSSGTSGKVNVTALRGEDKTNAGSFEIGNTTGGNIFRCDSLPEATESVRLVFERSSATGNLAIDDITVFHGSALKPLYLDNYKDLSTATLTEATVGPLAQDKEFFCTVRATDGTAVSLESDEIKLDKGAGLESIATKAFSIQSRTLSAFQEAAVYDLTGRLVAQVKAGESHSFSTPGMYILRAGGKSFKIFIP